MSSTRLTRVRRAQRSWTRLSDEQLLAMRFCDLKLRIERTPLAKRVRRLYRELDKRQIGFRPHVWLSEEWFSPDGVPGIAVPFYLAHPRLERLERRMMRNVEGGSAESAMRILRHEAGHAIDTAYRLRRRRRWREVFGPASLPYPDTYKARPGSRRYVQHLGEWYAQSHPCEDFAETFAVWLKPNSAWRRTYAHWPAYHKLRARRRVAGRACAAGARRCATAKSSSRCATTRARWPIITAANSSATTSIGARSPITCSSASSRTRRARDAKCAPARCCARTAAGS